MGQLLVLPRLPYRDPATGEVHSLVSLGPRYVPDFALTIDGDPIPAELRASITGVTLPDRPRGLRPGGASTLVNERLRWLDHPLLALDTDVRLSLGYARRRHWTSVFVGEIVGRECELSLERRRRR